MSHCLFTNLQAHQTGIFFYFEVLHHSQSKQILPLLCPRHSTQLNTFQCKQCLQCTRHWPAEINKTAINKENRINYICQFDVLKFVTKQITATGKRALFTLTSLRSVLNEIIDYRPRLNDYQNNSRTHFTSCYLWKRNETTIRKQKFALIGDFVVKLPPMYTKAASISN